MSVKQHSIVTTAIAATIENTINAALRYDPASQRAVSELTDILAIEVTSVAIPATTLFCQGATNGVRVMSNCESPVTTCLTGSPTALIGLLSDPHSLPNSSVELSGNIKLLQQWQIILDNLDIDWQTCLQHRLGDIAGPATAAAIGNIGHWLQYQWRYHQRQLSVYLQEELRVVPAKAEFDDLHQQVDELTLAVDRMQARVQHVSKKLDNAHLKKAHSKTPSLKNKGT